MQSASEEELVLQLKAKNALAFRHLYNAYAPALLGRIQQLISCPCTAEDILQTVFIKIWSYSDKYDATKGRLFTWMFNITRNTTIDYLRTHEASAPKLTIINTETMIKDMYYMDRLETRLDLRKLVGWLPLKERAIIDLVIAGFTCKEIGKLLHIPEGTVKTCMRNSYKKLQVSLQQ